MNIKQFQEIEHKKHKSAYERQREHKCYKCTWAKWSDIENATCAFGRCFREVTAQKYTKK